MTDTEKERIKYIAYKFIEMVEKLENNMVDLKNVSFDEEIMNYIMSDTYLKESKKIDDEIYRQQMVLLEVHSWIKGNCPDFKATRYRETIKDFKTYYLIEVFDGFVEEFSFIYDKGDSKLIGVSSNPEQFDVSGSFCGLDSNNILLVRRNKSYAYDLVRHFQRIDDKFQLVCDVDNICSSVQLVTKVGKESHLISFKNKDSGNLLYNYSSAQVMIENYTTYSCDDNSFNPLFAKEGIVITKNIAFKGMTLTLIYLIDYEGNLISDVYDLNHGDWYFRVGRGESQLEILQSIYKDARGDLREDYKMLHIKKKTS